MLIKHDLFLSGINGLRSRLNLIDQLVITTEQSYALSRVQKQLLLRDHQSFSPSGCDGQISNQWAGYIFFTGTRLLRRTEDGDGGSDCSAVLFCSFSKRSTVGFVGICSESIHKSRSRILCIRSRLENQILEPLLFERETFLFQNRFS